MGQPCLDCGAVWLVVRAEPPCRQRRDRRGASVDGHAMAAVASRWISLRIRGWRRWRQPSWHILRNAADRSPLCAERALQPDEQHRLLRATVRKATPKRQRAGG